MAQTMTASRTTYQNNYTHPPSTASVPADMHPSWHQQPHPTTNGINGVSSPAITTSTSTSTAAVRPKPQPRPPGSTANDRITAHKKSDFYKNGRPAEVIVIDSESPAPQPQSSSKRKRENSISASTTVSAVTKRARKSQNDETAILSSKSTYTHKPHTVAWFRDERGVYRAKEVIVPKVEEVNFFFPFVPLSNRSRKLVRVHASTDLVFPRVVTDLVHLG
jgi:hypothetical protein